jgi:hypothetical protein
MTRKFLATAAMVSIVAANSSFAVVPTLALTFDTNVTTYGMTSTQEAKIQRAEEKIRDVIGSEAFRTKVLNHTWNGIKQFNNNNGLTNSQIYTKILQGAEKLLPTKDNEMDLKIKVYYENSSTVGYTSSSSSYINMNTKYLNSYTPDSVAGNMTHEWLHKLGFSHSSTYSTSRNYSVPYAIGNIMRELAPNY